MEENKEFYTTNQVCEILNVKKAWLKKVLNRGLVRGVRRGRNHYRLISADQLELVRTLKYLSQGEGFMKDLKTYADLEHRGKAAEEVKKAFLETKKRQFWEELKNLQDAIDHIERKIEVIDKNS